MINSLFNLHTKWELLTLGEACQRGGGDVQTGPFGSQLHAADYVESGVPSIMPQNIGENRISENGIARITAEDATRLARYLVRAGDIVYSRRGDVERCSLIRAREAGWLCGTGCLRVRFGKGVVHPPYAAFYLRHPQVREWVVRNAQGATMPNLNTSILSSLPFVMPPARVQWSIAQILGDLDDKIELNRQINQTLEHIAQAMFKSWFVDFEPVKAKIAAKVAGEDEAGITRAAMRAISGKTDVELDYLQAAQAGSYHELKASAELFPGGLKKSDCGPLPIDWHIGTLGQIAIAVGTQRQVSELDGATHYVGLEHIPRKALALDNWGMAEGLESAKSCFSEGDILFGKLRPNFHKVVIAPFDGVCSTDILVCRTKLQEYYALVAMYLSSTQIIEYASRFANGAKMPRTNWGDLAAYPIVIPPANVAENFRVMVGPIFSQIRKCVFESQNLAALRDALLPKLLSGEINVDHIEINNGQ